LREGDFRASDLDVYVSESGDIQVRPKRWRLHRSRIGRRCGGLKVVTGVGIFAAIVGLLFSVATELHFLSHTPWDDGQWNVLFGLGGLFMACLLVFHVYLTQRSAWLLSGAALLYYVSCVMMCWFLVG